MRWPQRMRVSAFATVQGALDFAASHPHVAVNVCVAAGPSCGAAATISVPAGDLQMRDGISVHGSYEATGWTRCARATRLAPAGARGVVFDESIHRRTVLEGFEIGWPNYPQRWCVLRHPCRPLGSGFHAGTTTGAPATDLEGRVRTLPDIGAYEYAPEPVAVPLN